MVCLWPQAVFDCQEGNPHDYEGDISGICEQIHSATKGWGTNEDDLIAALGSLGPVERWHVVTRYESEYGEKLVDVMKKETGDNDFGTALQLLAQPIEEAQCSILKKACSGVGTNEKLVVLVLSGRTNKEIKILKKKFYDLYGEDLAVKMAGELRGDMEKFITACLQAEEEPYNPEIHTEEKAEEDARMFDKAGREQFGTDEATLFKIICESPPEYLKIVNLKYVERVGYSLVRSIEKELKGDAEMAAKHALNMKLKPRETASIFIESTMKGIGTDEYCLTASILMFQGIMGSGYPAYEKEYDKSLAKRVKGEVRGDFEKLLLAMIDANVRMDYVEEA